jgi:hypothetical protein
MLRDKLIFYIFTKKFESKYIVIFIIESLR